MARSVTDSDDLTFAADGKTPRPYPNHSPEAAAQLHAMSWEEREALDKKLVKKIDIRLVPWLT